MIVLQVTKDLNSLLGAIQRFLGKTKATVGAMQIASQSPGQSRTDRRVALGKLTINQHGFLCPSQGLLPPSQLSILLTKIDQCLGKQLTLVWIFSRPFTRDPHRFFSGAQG
ncbi:MAG: hypothetical protein VKO26_09320 [Cyanobacteriota bacterium]|nr:hypothetical protein [Cyanobacteriota bacterium]